MKISDLEGKRVAIWGYGLEGRAALAALRQNLPRQPVTVFCNRAEADDLEFMDDPQLQVVDHEPDVEALSAFEVVVKSPGISPYKTPAVEAQQAGVRFTSGTALWFGDHPEALTICVTGTKGKSTTSAMVAHLLRKAGNRTALAGNIGMPLLDLNDVDPPPDYWVTELSSYQTRDAVLPDVAAVTNLFPEHLDWHGSEERYFADKLALVREAMPERIVLNAADDRLADLRLPGADVRWYSGVDGWRQKGIELWRADQRVMEIGELPFSGEHNIRNLCAALTIVDALELDSVEMAGFARSFRTLPHRLQSFGSKEGIEYVNDSISTTPHASVAAMKCYAHRRVAVIVGGFDRGLDWSVFEEYVARNPPVAIITQGQNGPKIARQMGGLARKAAFELREVAELEEAVRLGERFLGHGGVVLMSPGAPSFPRYKNYIDRGRHFAQIAGYDPRIITDIPGLGIA